MNLMFKNCDIPHPPFEGPLPSRDQYFVVSSQIILKSEAQRLYPNSLSDYWFLISEYRQGEVPRRAGEGSLFKFITKFSTWNMGGSQ